METIEFMKTAENTDNLLISWEMVEFAKLTFLHVIKNLTVVRKRELI